MDCQGFAAASDVLDLQVGPAGPTEEQVQRLLDYAWVKLRGAGRAPIIDARLAAKSLDEVAVKLVLIEMVQAVLRNPTGQRSGSETTGPFGRSWSWGDVATATGRLLVTAEHLDLLELGGATAYTAVAPFASAWLPSC